MFAFERFLAASSALRLATIAAHLYMRE